MAKAVTILNLKHSSDGAHAIWAGRMLQTLRVRGGMSRAKGHAAKRAAWFLTFSLSYPFWFCDGGPIQQKSIRCGDGPDWCKELSGYQWRCSV